jgi:hypothetical protein
MPDPQKDRPDRKFDSSQKRGSSSRRTLKLDRKENPGEIEITATVKEFDFTQKLEIPKRDVEVEFFLNGSRNARKKTDPDGSTSIKLHHLPAGLYEVSANTAGGPFAKDSNKFTVKGEEYRMQTEQCGQEGSYFAEIQILLGTTPMDIKVMSVIDFDNPNEEVEPCKPESGRYDKLFFPIPNFKGRRKTFLFSVKLKNGKVVSDEFTAVQLDKKNKEAQCLTQQKP